MSNVRAHMSMPLPLARLLLLATVVAGVAFGLSLPVHSHRILVSVVFGICSGLLWWLSWRRSTEQSPEILEQMRRNVSEAQEILRNSFARKFDARQPVSPRGSSLSLEEILSDVISIVFAVCLASMVWVLPVFGEPSNISLGALAKAAGAHLFALLCVAIATFGLVMRLARKRGRAL